MPLYLLQMFSDTINSAVPFSRPLGQFLSPGSTLLALLGSASRRRPRLRFHELDYIQLTSVNCTHFVNRRRERDAASSSVLILLPATNVAHVIRLDQLRCTFNFRGFDRMMVMMMMRHHIMNHPLLRSEPN